MSVGCIAKAGTIDTNVGVDFAKIPTLVFKLEMRAFIVPKKAGAKVWRIADFYGCFQKK